MSSRTRSKSRSFVEGVAAALLLASCDACGGGDSGDEGRGPGSRGLERVTGDKTPDPTTGGDPFAAGPEDPAVGDPLGASPSGDEEGASSQKQQESGANDAGPPELGQELRRAAGDPGKCLTRAFMKDAPSTLSVRLRAHVSHSGRVTRSKVTGLPTKASHCLARRLEAHRFAAPVADAPRAVSTTLELRIRRPDETGDRASASTNGADTQGSLEAPAGGQWIQGPRGRQVDGPKGRPIQGPSGDQAKGTSPKPLEGPSGTSIGSN